MKEVTGKYIQASDVKGDYFEALSDVIPKKYRHKKKILPFTEKRFFFLYENSTAKDKIPERQAFAVNGMVSREDAEKVLKTLYPLRAGRTDLRCKQFKKAETLRTKVSYQKGTYEEFLDDLIYYAKDRKDEEIRLLAHYAKKLYENTFLVIMLGRYRRYSQEVFEEKFIQTIKNLEKGVMTSKKAGKGNEGLSDTYKRYLDMMLIADGCRFLGKESLDYAFY